MSSAPDIGALLAALQGGGGGMGGGMMGGAMQSGAMQDGMQGGAEDTSGDSIPDLLQQAIDLLHRAFAAETEPLDKQEIGKAMLLVQQIFATEQKEKDQALGSTAGVRQMRRNR